MDLKKLKEEQIRLSRKLELKDSLEKTELYGGADQAFYKDNIISCFVVLDKDLRLVEKQTAIIQSKIPYIPGFLGYREGPAILEAYNKIENKPDVIFVDGNGILHPRRFGMASQIGLILGKPSIGVAKKLLCGELQDDKVMMEDKVVGKAVKTKEHSNPLYVSPGNMISLKTAVELVKKTIVEPHKMPEPLHLAHKFSKQKRDQMDNPNME
ncbi:endonuclease V [Candidatus Woesearchaeota archaeon]|nr:endonuclease V [Candidatus Woesearchaeota archaeon]